MIGAAGIVFGDIGTSPLYTMKTVLELGGSAVDGASALGVFSLLVGTLFVVITIKYVNIAMRINSRRPGSAAQNDSGRHRCRRRIRTRSFD